ncbi:hypothetical protein BHE90_007444 [Fusarium euwallaceae]|uniref:Uncharacterized protein n=1 Tax=Fusarium euwallaceae TaxID=1147111 RepID=A0A430LQV2_9HYPO|nr:hypothetical protein BHE90_007444 [Fusarium euwallaceae]
MDAVVVRDNHQSFTQTFQGPCLRHVQSSPRPVPVPVPGTDAYPRTRGRVEGEPYDSVQDALLLSLPSSRSTSISEYSMPVDSVASLSSFHPASFGITKLDTVVSRSTPPPPAFVPPPRRSPTSLSRSSSQKLTSPVHQHSLPPVSKSHETLRPTSLPTSLPSFRQHLDSFRPQQATIPDSAPPSPPPRPPAASTPEDSGASVIKSPVHGSTPHKRFIELTPPPKISALAEDGSPSRVRRPSNFNRTAHLDVRFVSDSPSDSGTESWSESSLGPDSELDHIEPPGTRQFPPLPPSAPLVTPGVIRRKASMTNRITTWISQYERSQTPRPWSSTNTWVNSLPGANDTNKSDAPNVSAPPEDAVEQLWTKLKAQRAILNDIKSQMSRKRKRLQELRRARDQADNAFMGIIRPVLVNPNGSLETLRGNVDRRLAEMQRLRNEYQALERDYEDQEMTLDEEEEELNKLETNFFSLLAVGNTISIRPPNEPEPEHVEEDDTKDTPDLLRGISPNGPADDPHPLFQELMSAVGDLQNAKEDLDELLFLKGEHENELKMKTTANMELTTAEKEFLADFPADQERMSASVSKLQDKVTQLRELCEEKGAMQKHISSHVAYLLYPQQGYEDIDLDVDDGFNHSLAHAKFPVLLSQPEHLLEEVPTTAGGALKAAAKLPDSDPSKRGRMQLASKEYSIDRLIIAHNEGGKTDFVNRWLLHQLRLSPMKALLLYVTFTTSQGLKIRDLLRWQRDVLHYWWVTERRESNRAASESSDYESKFRTSQQSRRTSVAGSGVGSRLEWLHPH